MTGLLVNSEGFPYNMVEHLGVSVYGWDWDLVEMLYPAEESVLGHRGYIHATHEHTGPVSSDLGYSVLITEHAHHIVLESMRLGQSALWKVRLSVSRPPIISSEIPWIDPQGRDSTRNH